ncbi:hypothetical protein [Phytohabitans rumicis]|uniref:Uncharacterized protein n=1 Tax=Phytohabitans rumicis TaxID=1076125 RepID=A0A6V8KVR0_9ACTN|nr:hypothetical protein [Phytohabitans rumicis]GFJ89173.1 hypothetical protein Prum_028150 [Phytohabitans rumicis]
MISDHPVHGVDPVEDLASRVRPLCGTAVDALQVAAVLESDGMTDRIARDVYGYSDVFVLASEVHRRVPPAVEVRSAARPRTRWQTARELSHGLLYALPSAAYPAVLGLLGVPALVAGMVFATATGWVWGMGLSSVAYRMLGKGRPDASVLVLRWGVALGVVVAGAGAALLVRVEHLPAGVIALVVAQIGFQLSVGVLVMRRLEVVVFATMLPTVVLGVLYIVRGRPSTLDAEVVSVGIVSVGLTVVAAYVTMRRPSGRVTTDLPPAVAREVLSSLPVALYASLSAAYLLFIDVRFLEAPTELAISAAPLVLAMGAVEWRSRRFQETGVKLLRQIRYPWQFRSPIWAAFARGVAVSLLIPGMFAAALLIGLAEHDLLTQRGVQVTTAHVLLAGAYFTGFVLINHGRLPWVLGVLGMVFAGLVAAVATLSQRLAPYGEVPIFLASNAVLLALLVVVLGTSVSTVRLYRW